MKIYDISQEVFSCRVYPGDPKPTINKVLSMENGDVCNLTEFSMCAHNGTHVDAPYHFVNKGKTVDMLDLNKLVGYVYVVAFDGEITGSNAEYIINRAKCVHNDAWHRILIKGKGVVSEEAAIIFAEQGIYLIGSESQTVGPEDAPAMVHNILLSNDIVLLEGICLEKVKEGVYILSSAPLNLAGCDGSPCRAILIDMEHDL
ncbi:MAG: cyclase family protein [Clostridia bacterium]|nr:cyclase family protein [Clostridia bacterium]